MWYNGCGQENDDFYNNSNNNYRLQDFKMQQGTQPAAAPLPVSASKYIWPEQNMNLSIECENLPQQNKPIFTDIYIFFLYFFP